MIAMRCPPMYSDFYPRPPRGGRPLRMHSFLPVLVFLSTPSARRATNTNLDNLTHTEISIHALREEGDQIRCRLRNKKNVHFYPRPPRGGRLGFPSLFRKMSNFYPRPPRGGRRFQFPSFFHNSVISIHALREEGDQRFLLFIYALALFLSTPSARRATWENQSLSPADTISIHALREEGDAVQAMKKPSAIKFLSTPSARRATSASHGTSPRRNNFYPRPPRGGRHFPL